MTKYDKKTKKSSDEDYITLDFSKLPLSWAILLSTVVFTAGIGSAIYFGLKAQGGNAEILPATTEDALIPTEPPMPTLGDAEYSSISEVIKELPGKGDKDSEVVVIEFGEYSCSACQAYQATYFSPLYEGYIKKGTARMYYADVPRVPTYAVAQYYGICLNDLYGEDVFFKYHDEIFENPSKYMSGAVDEGAIKAYISSMLNKDAKKVQDCVEKTNVSSRMETYRSLLVAVSGESWATPTFFVGRVENGKVLDGEVTVGAGPGTLEVLVEKYLGL